MPCPRDLGRIEAGAVGKSDQETLVVEHMLEHADEKVGRARGVADSVRRYAGYGKKGGHSLSFCGDERKRLNCQHFGRFRRCPCAFIHGLPFAFP